MLLYVRVTDTYERTVPDHNLGRPIFLSPYKFVWESAEQHGVL